MSGRKRVIKPQGSRKGKLRIRGRGTVKGKRKNLVGKMLEEAVEVLLHLLSDRRVPDGRLSSKQAWWWFSARGGIYAKVEYRTFKSLLGSSEILRAKWALKGSGRGSKGDAIIDERGEFAKFQISDADRARLPLIEVIDLLREKDATLLLARPSDMTVRLLDELLPMERLELRFADRLAFAGAKRPSHQNELYNAATMNRQQPFSRLRFSVKAWVLYDVMKDNVKNSKGYLLTSGQFGNACGSQGLLDFCNKVTTWYDKSVERGEEAPGEDRPKQMVLFLEMVDEFEDKHAKERKSSVVSFCACIEKELSTEKIGYGEGYGSDQAVRSAESGSFPSTLLHPYHELSSTPFDSVVDMQPNRNKDGEKILEIMGAGVTVGEVGDAYRIDGWMVICMLCILKHLSNTDLTQKKLAKLQSWSASFLADSGFHASPRVFGSWLAAKAKPWKTHVYAAGKLKPPRR
jgi:hypothetical protein